MYEYTLTAAAVTGELWWPIGIPAYKEAPSFGWRVDRVKDHPRRVNGGHITLRDAAELLLAREEGDFSTPALLADPMLTVRKVGRTRTIVRTFDLAKSRTIADYIDRDWSGFPEWEDE